MFVGNFTQICVKLTQACVKFFFTQGLCEFCHTRKTQNSKSVAVTICVAILSAIPKRSKLLDYREMYNDLKNQMSINQHGFM
jgi:hypothetical protein